MTKSNDQIHFLRFEDRLEGRKGEIIKAAFDCIFEVGIAASSTHVIAAKANLHQGSIHYYFDSKDELLKSVLEVFFQNSTSNIETVAKSDLPPLKKLQMVFKAGLSLIGPRSKEFVVFIALWSHAISLGGDMLALYRNLFVRFRVAIGSVIRDGESQGIFRAGVSEELALLIVGAVEGIGFQFVLDPENLNPQSAIDLLESIIAKSVQ